MDTPPAEIITQIMKELSANTRNKGTIVLSDGKAWRVQLARYSSISHTWKACVERFTFRILKIATDELDNFAALFNGDISRWPSLTSLTVDFILPDPINPMGCCTVVRPMDRKADSIAFSTAVVKLFAILAAMDARAASRPPLSLHIWGDWRVSWRTQPRGSTRVPCQTGRNEEQHGKWEVEDAKAKSGQSQLIHKEHIPTVNSKTGTDFRYFGVLADLKPSSIGTIVARLPNVEELHIMRTDPYGRSRQIRHGLREHLYRALNFWDVSSNSFETIDLSRSIRSLTSDHPRDIRLDVSHEPMENEGVPIHQFVDRRQWHQ